MVTNTHFLLEPAHGLLFADAVSETDAARFPLLVGDAEAGSAQNLNTKSGTELIRKASAEHKKGFFITQEHPRNMTKSHPSILVAWPLDLSTG